MNKERKADLESKLVELEHEIWLAAKQGQIENVHTWQAAIHVEGDPYIVMLTVAPVGETKSTTQSVSSNASSGNQ